MAQAATGELLSEPLKIMRLKPCGGFLRVDNDAKH
jgi:hypothetical protein